MDATIREVKPLYIRGLSDDGRAALEQEAKANHRSLSAQVAFILEQYAESKSTPVANSEQEALS